MMDQTCDRSVSNIGDLIDLDECGGESLKPVYPSPKRADLLTGDLTISDGGGGGIGHDLMDNTDHETDSDDDPDDYVSADENHDDQESKPASLPKDEAEHVIAAILDQVDELVEAEKTFKSEEINEDHEKTKCSLDTDVIVQKVVEEADHDANKEDAESEQSDDQYDDAEDSVIEKKVESVRENGDEGEDSLQILDLNKFESSFSSMSAILSNSFKDMTGKEISRDSLREYLKESRSFSPMASHDLFSINELDMGFIGGPDVEDMVKDFHFSTPNVAISTPAKSPISRLVQRFKNLSLVTPPTGKFDSDSHRMNSDLSSINFYRQNDSSQEERVETLGRSRKSERLETHREELSSALVAELSREED